ncbi:MAG: response regulator transcription factor [Chloroflexi bacterium]|nr:response regulator transcription factor [Chloroflexota bacterium]
MESWIGSIPFACWTVPMTSILVVDDERAVRDVVRLYLEQDGYDVSTASNGPDALAAFESDAPDLVVLDLMLPELSGEEICRYIRQTSDVAIIMLTARGAESERLTGLQLGADDYVVKPFSPRELVARVKAVLRRAAPAVDQPEGSISAGDLEIDPTRRTVLRDGHPVTLAAREFDLLLFFAQHPQQVFSREQLLENVWGWEFEGDISTVTVHVRRLRSKIEVDDRNPRHLVTIWSVGYKFVE